MKKLAILALPLAVMGCASPAPLPSYDQALKDQCLTPDYPACAELGHLARQDMGYWEPRVPSEPISRPIVD